MIKHDLAGRRFAKLTVIEFAFLRKGCAYWKCKCDCGKETTVARTNLQNAKSCGCVVLFRGKQSKHWKGCGDIAAAWLSSLKSNAKRRNIKINVTLKHLWGLFCQQNRKCALSGLELTFPKRYRNRGTKGSTASLDRIDSLKGIKGNVQWLHKDINMMKQRLDQKYFIHLCSLIHQQQG